MRLGRGRDAAGIPLSRYPDAVPGSRPEKLIDRGIHVSERWQATDGTRHRTRRAALKAAPGAPVLVREETAR